MKLAIMQPYFFPYIGYYQLINAVDRFVFYDDVHFIKKGWIHRNKILVNGQETLFTVPIENASQNSLINALETKLNDQWRRKFFRTLAYNYRQAKYYDQVIDMIHNVLQSSSSLADICINSIMQSSKYLALNTEFFICSEHYSQSRGMDRADRLIHICHENQSETYINMPGGMALYDKQYFENQGVQLCFIKGRVRPYQQFNDDFIPGLSMIDVMMFNDRETIQTMLYDYQLV